MKSDWLSCVGILAVGVGLVWMGDPIAAAEGPPRGEGVGVPASGQADSKSGAGETAQVKPESESDIKSRAKPEVKPEGKAEAKGDGKADAKGEVKAESPPEAKSETKAEEPGGETDGETAKPSQGPAEGPGSAGAKDQKKSGRAKSGAGPSDPPAYYKAPPKEIEGPSVVEGQEAGIEVGQYAPDFQLQPIEPYACLQPWLGADGPEGGQKLVTLSDLVGEQPILLLFGSYT